MEGGAHVAAAPPKPPPAVPGRTKILISSIIFCIASALLLLQFLALHCDTYLDASCHSGWANGHLVDWSGAISCIGWFCGFSLLIDWLVFDTFDAWGPSRRALVGATLKLIASAFFCVEPFSDMAGYLNAVPAPPSNASLGAAAHYPAAFGVPWSNFVGILFFHAGNCIDALGMLPLFNWSKPCAGANLPVVGMQTYMCATWLLAIAGGIAYAQTPFPWGPAGAWGAGATGFVAPAQIAGAVLLLVGSVLYTAWAALVGRAAPTTPEPLLNAERLVPGFA